MNYNSKDKIKLKKKRPKTFIQMNLSAKTILQLGKSSNCYKFIYHICINILTESS